MTDNLFPDALWLIRQARPYLRLQVTGLTCMLISSLLYLCDPLILKRLLDTVLPRRDGRGLVLALFMIFSLYVARTLLNGRQGFLTLKASQKLVLDLRRRLLRHLDHLSADYHEREPVGARFYLFQEPMEEISVIGADLLPCILRTTVLTISVFGVMFVLNPHLAATVVPVVGGFVIVKRKYSNRLRSGSNSVQDDQQSASSFLQEHLRSIVQLQLLRAESRQEKRVFQYFAKIVRTRCALWRASVEFSMAATTLTALGIVVVLGIGGREVIDNRLTIGGLVAFYTLLTRLYEPLSSAVEVYSRLQRAGASVRKVKEAFDLRPSVNDRLATGLRTATAGMIAFDEVTFAYPGRRAVLSGLNLRIHRAGRVALVGANGSGKSTMGKLMARLYDPQSGSIRIDGTDIRELAIENLRNLVCYLPQHAVLFDSTLLENLCFGIPSSTESEIETALEVAGLHRIVARLPGGLGGPLGPEGNRLSGGERQRIAIARAIMQRPKILILDEATSFLDGRAEEEIFSRLVSQFPATTIVIISHHPSALVWAHEIFRLHEGSIVAEGNERGACDLDAVVSGLLQERSEERQAAIASVLPE
jgi:ABC-type bacteriocin/lantibiotic exporter with double-glycine peptidase domain